MAHPYKEFEETQLWSIVNGAVADLEENQDLSLTTGREYVVGYICKKLTDSNSTTAESNTINKKFG